MTDPLLPRLMQLDSCALSDAMDRLGLRGVVSGLSALSAGRKIAGTAVTVQLGPDNGGPRKRHLCTAAVDAAGAGSIIVIEHGGRVDVAGWGGTLARGASRNRVEGVIIDGASRDIDECRAVDLPVYAKAGVPTTARGRMWKLTGMYRSRSPAFQSVRAIWHWPMAAASCSCRMRAPPKSSPPRRRSQHWKA